MKSHDGAPRAPYSQRLRVPGRAFYWARTASSLGAHRHRAMRAMDAGGARGRWGAAMLNALSVALPAANEQAAHRAARSMEQQGFVDALRLPWPGGLLQAWAHPTQRDVADTVVRMPAGSACCVGPLWYRGRFGCEALKTLIDEVADGKAIDEPQLRGNYALFIQTRARSLLLTDAFGFVRIYSSPDGAFHSTSWLAACAYAGTVEPDEGAAIQYVLLGASHSDQTPAAGIATLPLGRVVDLDRGKQMARPGAEFDAPVPAVANLDDAVQWLSAHLATIFKEVAAAFPGRVRMALSGGFDSRLILAGLRSAGMTPELFVYGDSGSTDVRIARLVAASVGAPLAVTDKGTLDRGASLPDREALVHSARFFDGLPPDGILDRGSDRATRLEQTVGGFLAMNGGGGEIFRNFFHLPERPFRAIDVVRTFYRGFDRSVFRRPRGLRDYQESMVASMEHLFRAAEAQATVDSHGTLARAQVELLYPLFRCHYWMGVNNSIAVRHGYYATPLVDLDAVRLSSRLPLAWKEAGLLEGRLIARLDPVAAAQPSAYGFRFTEDPDRRARGGERAMAMRPPILRPMINAVRRRLHGVGVASADVVKLRQILPGEWRTDTWLDLDKLPDEGALHRAFSLEAAWRLVLNV